MEGKLYTRFVKLFGRFFKLQMWAYCKPFSCDSSGKWPFCIWLYKWGIGFHWKTVADAHIQLDFG